MHDSTVYKVKYVTFIDIKQLYGYRVQNLYKEILQKGPRCKIRDGFDKKCRPGKQFVCSTGKGALHFSGTVYPSQAKLVPYPDST